jgi:radical SAM protein (TIGR01212 family)
MMFTFRRYSSYLKEKYGEAVYRVSVDAGFTCPYRNSDRSGGGCTYCDERGSHAPYLGEEINLKKQIEKTIAFLKKRYKAHLYILYFQAFTNTYAKVEELKKIYDYGLSCAPFKELIVSTRPDCIDGAKAKLLSSYLNSEIDVWVELGLQSANNNTLKRINRGHSVEDFMQAYLLLKQSGLKIAVHIIFGLPGENYTDIINTIQFLQKLNPDGIKIHNLHISRGSYLAKEYEWGEITVPTPDRHLEYTIKALTMLPAQTVIMRLTCDTPPSHLVAPRHFWHKSHFYSLVKTEMKKRKVFQGSAFKKS